MKKLIILIVALGAIGLLSWYAINLNEKKGKSDTELIEFGFKSVDNIDRVIITDQFSRTFELVKAGDEWTDKDGGCVTQESVGFVLDAFKNIEFKGYLPDSSHKNAIKRMSAMNIKVEIFEDGEWSKTWYIGPSSQDHYGQMMLLESKTYGKSDIPVLMKIKGVNGIIEPRFFADSRKWMCTNIFKLGLPQISEVDVKFNDEPERSFTVKKKGAQMDVFQQGKLLSNVDTAMIFRYLNNYRKIHFDIPNYELNEKQIDSLKRTTPFCVLTVTENTQRKTKLRLFRIQYKSDIQAGLGNVVDIDKNKLWAELPNGELVKCQYFVFNPLLLGHVYFPMNLDGLKTHDGITPK